MTRVPTIASAILLLLAASGCGDEPDPQVQESPADLSPDGIAAVVADHVERPAQEVAAWDVMTRELGVESPGASIDYGSGVGLAVSVAPTSDSPFVCADESFFDACVDFDHDGHELALGWQQEEPEEDPGVVYVVDRREDEDVLVRYTGASITGDPREQDLGISVEEMADVVTDARLTLR